MRVESQRAFKERAEKGEVDRQEGLISRRNPLTRGNL